MRILLIIIFTLPIMSCGVKKVGALTEVATSNEPKNPMTTKGAPFPDFNYVTSAMNLEFSSKLPDGPVMLVLFNPGCGHCKEIAIDIQKNIDKFEGISIVYMTGKNLLGMLPNFVAECGLGETENFIVCADNSEITSQLFDMEGIPQMMFYNTERKLQEVMYKELQMDEALKALRK